MALLPEARHSLLLQQELQFPKLMSLDVEAAGRMRGARLTSRLLPHTQYPSLLSSPSLPPSPSQPPLPPQCFGSMAPPARGRTGQGIFAAHGPSVILLVSRHWDFFWMSVFLTLGTYFPKAFDKVLKQNSQGAWKLA